MSKSLFPVKSPLRRFRNVARVVWAHLGLPEPTPLQLDVCDWLEKGPKNSITMGFRGMGKSYLTAAYAAYSLALNPDELIMVISAGKERADLFTKFLRRLINEIDVFKPLIPNMNRGDMDSAVSFQVGCSTPQQSPSVVSKGIGGQLSGSRASLIILDDIEVPNNSATPTLRAKLTTAIEEVAAILLPETETIKPRVRVLGTPQSAVSVYTKLEGTGYQTRIWPIEIPDEVRMRNYADKIAPFIKKLPGLPGDPVEPTRFGPIEIRQRRTMYGASGYTLQFLLDTHLTDAEKYPLKLKDLIVAEFPYQSAREIYVHGSSHQCLIRDLENVGLDHDGFYSPADIIGDPVPFDLTVVAVDPSGRGSNDTGISAVSTHSGQVFVHSCFGVQGGYSEPVLETIAREAKKVRAHKIVVEKNFGDGMFTQLLRPVVQRIYPCTIEEVSHSKQKEVRIIETLEPITSTHRMIVHRRVIEADIQDRPDDAPEYRVARQLFHQFTHITKERGCLMLDDLVDTLAIGVNALNETLDKSARAEAIHREQDEEMEEVYSGNTWLTNHSDKAPIMADIFQGGNR